MNDRPRRPTRLLSVGIVGLFVAIPVMIASLRISGQLIVPPGEVVTEDVYAFGNRTIIEGTIDGDLFVMTSRLDISGTVTGDVLGVVGGPVSISGTVGGSVRLAATALQISGDVTDDVAVVVGDLDMVGEVGRDVFTIAGGLTVLGPVGRDIRAQSIEVVVDAAIGRDVLVRADRVTLGDDARVGGDVLYKASRAAQVSGDAVVAGTLTRRQVIAPLWAKVVTRLFAIVSFFGFMVAGLLALWVFRGLSTRAVAVAEEHPGKSALIGLGILVGPPLLMLPLFLTLVGLPVALLLLLFWILALFLGPLPAVTAAGRRLISGRGGLAGGLLIGTVLWRGSMWVLPLIATLLYLAALLVGLGAYGSAAMALRREHAPA